MRESLLLPTTPLLKSNAVTAGKLAKHCIFGRSWMRQFSHMPNPSVSKSNPKPEHPTFITIDDCVNQAQDLFSGLQKLSQIKYPLDIRRGIRKEVKDDMEEDKISHQLKGSGRTYFFDMEKTREGKAYLRITESRKGKGDKFERNSIHVFPEDAVSFARFVSAMTRKLAA